MQIVYMNLPPLIREIRINGVLYKNNLYHKSPHEKATCG